MKTEKQLLEQRASLLTQMNDIVRSAEKDGRDVLSAEEDGRYTKFHDECSALEKQIETARLIEQRRAQFAETIGVLGSKEPVEDPTRKEEAGKQRYAKVWTKYMQKGPGFLSSEEQSILHTYGRPQRGTSVQITGQGGDDTLGGYLVPQEFSNELERRMKLFGGMLEACRIIRTAGGGQIDWPTIDDTSNTGNLTGESSNSAAGTVAVKDFTFGQKQLEAWLYDSGVAKVSIQLLQDSYFDLDDFVADAFAERLGRKVNYDLTLGTGSSQPNGIITALNAASRTTNAINDDAVDRKDPINLIYAVDRVYRTGPNVGFMLNDTTLKAFRILSAGTSATDARPLWQPSMRVGEPDTLEGYRFWVNNDMAEIGANNRIMIFGDFSKYVVRMVQDMVVVPLRERYMDELRWGYIAYMRVDGECIQPFAFSALRNINT